MLIACAIISGVSVGVDVEMLNKDISVLSIAGSYLARSEFETLKELSTSARHWRFFEFWALKEAYIKAYGSGLSMPLDKFSFALDDGKIRATFDPDLGDSAVDWQFALDYIGTDHVLAVGIPKKCSDDYSITIQQAPLRALAVAHAAA